MPIIKTEKRFCRSEQRMKRVSAGKCPHCKLLFSNPVTLTCGHSLCALCCQELLERRQSLEITIQSDPLSTPKAHAPNTPMRTPMMGISILSELNETPTKISPSGRTPARPPKRFSLVIRTPECPVCDQPASNHAPIKNYALQQLIRQMSRRKRDLNLATYKNPLYSVSEQRETLSPRPSSSSSGFESEPNVENVCIKKCNISILGHTSVGKTQLTRTQYLNNLFFGQIDAEKSEKAGIDDMGTELFAKYLIHIIDNSDLTKSLIEAHGFVFLYSITDRESFEQLSKIINEVQSARKDEPAMIVCGTKSDLDSLRRVSSYEGQQLARTLNCPFFEVSAKQNDCVNEIFAQLVQTIDKNGF